MRIRIVAIGRLRPGPERALIDDYLKRAARTGRPQGLTSVEVIEVDDRKPVGKAGEAEALARAVPDGAIRVALDERGKQLTSPEFSQKLATWRDDGARDIAFVIGGADGLDRPFVKSADMVLSFGKMVWPHMLARVMLAEQVYRATAILAGTPYHRA